jgi:hypothetical protein
MKKENFIAICDKVLEGNPEAKLEILVRGYHKPLIVSKEDLGIGDSEVLSINHLHFTDEDGFDRSKAHFRFVSKLDVIFVEYENIKLVGVDAD